MAANGNIYIYHALCSNESVTKIDFILDILKILICPIQSIFFFLTVPNQHWISNSQEYIKKVKSCLFLLGY